MYNIIYGRDNKKKKKNYPELILTTNRDDKTDCINFYLKNIIFPLFVY